MSFQKKSINLILLLLVVLGCIFAQRISMPLKVKENGQLYFSVKIGTRQCQVDVVPNIERCTNLITQTSFQTSYCGATFYNRSSYTKGINYSSIIQLNEIETNIIYTVPDQQNPQYGVNQLCFGFQYFDDQRNFLIQIFQAGLLTEERVYFSINDSKTQDGKIGEIDIGAPNKRLIKKGAKIQELKSEHGGDFFTAISNNSLKFFGQQLDTRSLVFVSLNYPHHYFTSAAFEKILIIFDMLEIKYTYSKEKNNQVLLPSIEKLKPFEFSLILKNDTEYPISLKPAQYTRQLANGQYQLLIQPQPQARSIVLSYSLFEAYYVGFDLPHRTILIAEKTKEQIDNLSGSSDISE